MSAIRSVALAAALCLAAPGHAAAEEAREAWFYSRGEGTIWCAFVTEASARAAEEDERNDWGEIGWVRYREGRIETVRVSLQSEDAYVEDTYSFAPDLSVERLVRNGHYFDYPFSRVTFERDESGVLRMNAESRAAVDAQDGAVPTYFFEWPFYSKFAELPFASLIKAGPRVSVAETCRDVPPAQS